MDIINCYRNGMACNVTDSEKATERLHSWGAKVLTKYLGAEDTRYVSGTACRGWLSTTLRCRKLLEGYDLKRRLELSKEGYMWWQWKETQRMEMRKAPENLVMGHKRIKVVRQAETVERAWSRSWKYGGQDELLREGEESGFRHTHSLCQSGTCMELSGKWLGMQRWDEEKKFVVIWWRMKKR